MDAIFTLLSTSVGISLAALITAVLIALAVLVVRCSDAAGPSVPRPPPTPAPGSTQARVLGADSSQLPEARAGPVDKSVSTLSTQPEEAEEAAETGTLIETPKSLPSHMQCLRLRFSGSGSLGRTIVQVLSRGELEATDWEGTEDILLIADLGLDTVDGPISRMKERVAIAGTSDSNMIRTLLVEELLVLVNESFGQFLYPGKQDESGELPATILMVDVNGVGKTVTVDKLACVLAAESKSVLLGVADTFRAAAVEQLSIWNEHVGVDIVKSDHEGADPAAVAFDAVERGTTYATDVVLVGTAGRFQTESILMEELDEVKRVMEKQALVSGAFFVLGAATEQNGLKQAQVFAKIAGVTGIVLTKPDGSAKGGIAVPVQKTLGVSVKFVGLGEGADDLAPSSLRSFVNTIVNS